MDLWRLQITPEGRSFILSVVISHRDREPLEAALCNLIAGDCRAGAKSLVLSLADWLGLCHEVDQWAMTYAADKDDRRTAGRFAAAVQNMLNRPPHERREEAATPQPIKMTQMKLI